MRSVLYNSNGISLTTTTLTRCQSLGKNLKKIWHNTLDSAYKNIVERNMFL